jgi:hypothetical protein
MVAGPSQTSRIVAERELAMRRMTVLLSAVIMLGIVLVGGGALVTAQDGDTADHPLVGTWSLTPGQTDQPMPDVIIFSADGGVVDVESDGSVSLGAWEATGEATANMTLTVYSAEEGAYRIRAAIEVAPDGQSFTAPYTLEVFDPASGESMGEYGPDTATATRLAVEGPGTPVGSLEDLFSQFEGSPEASPVP